MSITKRVGKLMGLPRWQSVKNSPAVQEAQQMWIRSLGQEDPLEKEMAIYSSILAWEDFPWIEEPGGYSP